MGWSATCDCSVKLDLRDTERPCLFGRSGLGGCGPLGLGMTGNSTRRRTVVVDLIGGCIMALLLGTILYVPGIGSRKFATGSIPKV
jgi:hypothetical protein